MRAYTARKQVQWIKISLSGRPALSQQPPLVSRSRCLSSCNVWRNFSAAPAVLGGANAAPMSTSKKLPQCLGHATCPQICTYLTYRWFHSRVLLRLCLRWPCLLPFSSLPMLPHHIRCLLFAILLDLRTGWRCSVWCDKNLLTSLVVTKILIVYILFR